MLEGTPNQRNGFFIEAGANVDVKTHGPECGGMTPLCMAAVKGEVEVVFELLKAGADTEVTFKHWPILALDKTDTALTAAENFGHKDVALQIRVFPSSVVHRKDLRGEPVDTRGWF